MRATIFSKTAIALASVMLVHLFAQPAAANQPLISRMQFSEDFTIPGGAFCAFPIQVAGDIRVVTKIFLDQWGNPVRFAGFVTDDLTITNLDNGKSLAGRDASTEFFDLPNLLGSTFVGLPFRIKLPHGGTISFDAGKIVLDTDGNITFVAGPHPLAQSGFNLPGIACPALE